jgi:hypothetical protein
MIFLGMARTVWAVVAENPAMEAGPETKVERWQANAH